MTIETEMNVSNVGDLTQDGGEKPYVVTALGSGSRRERGVRVISRVMVCGIVVCLCVCVVVVTAPVSACERRIGEARRERDV